MFRTILVIGDNYKDIVKKYSADTKDNEDNSHYQYERCHQYRLEKTGQEGDFSDPFPLKDGSISYSAHYNDIDWSLIHQNPKSMEKYKKMWDVVVEGKAPKDKTDEYYLKMMSNRQSYFNNFKNCEQFIKYSTSFWHWGIATEEKYEDAKGKDALEWISGFFEKFIKPLEKNNELITIYEVKILE